MTIGQKIKELRIKKQLTQEKLAEALFVSYQAVSKWENDTSTPDISLIGPLTRILHVTADELLGLNNFEHDARYKELTEAYDHTYATEDLARRQEICETAVREYPGDMRFLCELAGVVSSRSFEYEEQDAYVAQQEKAIKLYDSVIRNCRDEVLRSEAIDRITQLLGWRGRLSEAKAYAEMLPERKGHTRESVWENCLAGEELIRYKQERIMGHLEGILYDLSLLPTGEKYTDLIESLITTMFPDGRYILFDFNLFCAYQAGVSHELRTNPSPREERILEWLRKMLASAKRCDEMEREKPGIYRYSAPWFDRLDTDSREWLGREGKCWRQRMKEYLEEEKFDFLRGDERFAEIYGEL